MSCNHCGQCCKASPCLVGGPEEIAYISEYVGYDVRQHLQIERTPDGHRQVRISNKSPCVFFNGKCSIEEVKPKGGLEYECWNPATFSKTYYWSDSSLAAIGIRLLGLVQ